MISKTKLVHTAVVAVLVILTRFETCYSHGRLVDPPGRSSAWRYGFNTPINYNDHELFCGGRQVQWEQNLGKCGICGDHYNGPRDHEAGGRYATGTIVKRYSQGQVIEVKVELTANHKGWFEFRLCPNNNLERRVSQRCLDRGLLRLVEGGGTRFPVSSDMRMVSVLLRLPRGMTCTQCVLQWKYNTGNSWGTDSQTGESCVGCGPQEQFYGCADISIGRSSGTRTSQTNKHDSRTSNNNRRQTQIAVVNRNRNGHQKVDFQGSGTPRRRMGASQNCRAIQQWQANLGMDQWCQNNCSQGYCPSSHCRCS